MSEEEKFEGTLEEGRPLFRTYQLAAHEVEKVKKAEMVVKRMVQFSGTDLVKAKRKWEQWMNVAKAEDVERIVNDNWCRIATEESS